MSYLIEDEFYMYKNKFFTYLVKLNLDFLVYTPNSNNNESIVETRESIKDISGCALMKLNKNKPRTEVFLKIYLYPLVGASKTKRKRKTLIFEVSNKNSFEDNLNVANKWRSLIYFVMYFSKGKPNAPLYKQKKKLLVFINPKSGPGIALKIFEEKVKPVLAETEVEYDLIITSHAKHAYELVQNKDFEPFSGIICIGGDGLIYEIYNGINQRIDRESILSIPIGVIPGGSGNGFASSISHLINEPYLSNPVLVSTLNIANPVAFPIDLILLKTHQNDSLISFISVGLGLMADIDIDSERLRAIGEARFTIYGVARVFNLHKYKIRLSYKIAHDVLASATKLKDKSYLARSQTVQEDINENQDMVDYEKVRPSSLSNSNEFICAQLSSEGSLERITKIKEAEALDKRKEDVHIAWTPSMDHIESGMNLDEPVPNDWETIEDEFISIYAVNMPFINSTAVFSPKSKLDDGVLWLSYIRNNVSRTTLFKYLLGLDSGTHINVPGVVYIPVTDLRIVPLCPTGKITIDGELIDFGPLQATVLPNKGRYMVRRP